MPNLQNPVLQNPNLQNPNLQNPSIQNPHLQNPNLQNPNLQNPVLQNDAVANPSIVNPNLQNPNLQNPTLQNPNLQNPSLQNPNLQNAGISDTNWVVTNEGNTTASYTVNLLLNTPVPADFTTQLLIHKTFTTPAADGCDLKEQPHTILLANIPNPQFVTDADQSEPAEPASAEPEPAEPDAGARARRIGDDHAPHHRPEHLRRRDLRRLGRGDAGGRRAVGEHRRRRGWGAPRRPVAMPLTITTTEIPPTTPGAPINRTLQTVTVPGMGAVTLLGRPGPR